MQISYLSYQISDELYPHYVTLKLTAVLVLTNRVLEVSWWTQALSPAPPAGRRSSSGSPGWRWRPRRWTPPPAPAALRPGPSTAPCGNNPRRNTPPFPGRSSLPRSGRCSSWPPKTSLRYRRPGSCYHHKAAKESPVFPAVTRNQLTRQPSTGDGLRVQFVGVLEPHQSFRRSGLVVVVGEVLPLDGEVGDKRWKKSNRKVATEK